MLRILAAAGVVVLAAGCAPSEARDAAGGSGTAPAPTVSATVTQTVEVTATVTATVTHTAPALTVSREAAVAPAGPVDVTKEFLAWLGEPCADCIDMRDWVVRATAEGPDLTVLLTVPRSLGDFSSLCGGDVPALAGVDIGTVTYQYTDQTVMRTCRA